ncbi:hypothetical protein [Photobacterium kishitanii]|uniref:Uncharacterized protein n=1 Tax=Photobacterium kishitanii TaxID=318456 RepID=A0A2T3KMB7_9GAMM|nr:hypothetical protein [Photobacterium kishitanii]PSV00943.1 hypothetical protein C9J27_02655 [Photobacterium kishitanii]
MIKVNILKERESVRSRRLRKKLQVSEFAQCIRNVSGRVPSSDCTSLTNQMLNDVFPALKRLGVYLGFNTSGTKDNFTHIDGFLFYQVGVSLESIVETLKPYIVDGASLMIGEELDANYDERRQDDFYCDMPEPAIDAVLGGDGC